MIFLGVTIEGAKHSWSTHSVSALPANPLDPRVYSNSNMADGTHLAPSRPELSRDLGVSHASAVVVGTIIGSGIFLVPAEMMQAVGSAKLVYLGWLGGGGVVVFGAPSYAEMGALKAAAGGGVG